jgi:hypothetical protein
MKNIIIIGALLLLTIGCDESSLSQISAKTYGGVTTVKLSCGIKLENITWKGESNLWLLTRPMRMDEKAETHKFEERSTFGVFQGTVAIVECK